jgi:hypothetical protein
VIETRRSSITGFLGYSYSRQTTSDLQAQHRVDNSSRLLDGIYPESCLTNIRETQAVPQRNLELFLHSRHDVDLPAGAAHHRHARAMLILGASALAMAQLLLPEVLLCRMPPASLPTLFLAFVLLDEYSEVSACNWPRQRLPAFMIPLCICAADGPPPPPPQTPPRPPATPPSKPPNAPK